jgi:hypothetical protein
MTFNTLHSLILEEFKKSSKHIHLFDVPMFSVYIAKSQEDNFDKLVNINLENILAQARNEIIKIGFPAMHANILFDDITYNNKRIGGAANTNGKFMRLNINLDNLELELKNIIVHEWAHLWMYNNSSGFKKAVKEFYQTLIRQSFDTTPNKDESFGYSILKSSEFFKFVNSKFTEMVNTLKKNKNDLLKDNSDLTSIEIHQELYEYLQDWVTLIVRDLVKYVNSLVPDNEMHLKIANFRNKIDIDKVQELFSNIIDEELLTDIMTDSNTSDILIIKYLINTKVTHSAFSQFHVILNKNNLNNELLLSRATKHLQDLPQARRHIAELIEWVNDYGLSNEHEIWATAIEHFLKLTPKYRKEIFKLMDTKNNRETPNRTMRKKMK